MNPSQSFPRRMAGVLLAFCLPAAAQMDLGNLNLRTVRAVDAGIVALPRFDTVALDVQVHAGVAKTRATLVWTATAGAKALYNWRCRAPEPETTFVSELSWLYTPDQQRLYHDTVHTYWSYGWSNGKPVDSILSSYHTRVTTCRVDSISYRESKLDSLELSSSFQLPTDAAVTDLDLWVGDRKQSAWIMDRWQASAQYNSIVGVRRDPALLETWGGGSYSLRVFPQTTGQTRRLEIEFVHAWRPGMPLPVGFSRAPNQQTSVWNNNIYTTFERKGQTPGHLEVSLASMDGAPVSMDLGSLGTMTAGTMPETRVFTSPATFLAKVPAGAGSVWSSIRDGRPSFGAHLQLQGTEFTVETPPRDRLVVLEATVNVERARRLALLALVQYGATEDHRVDLAWREADGSLKRLWGTPRAFTSEAALEALVALKAWAPTKAIDPLFSLQGLLDSDSGRVVILLSDAESPSFSEPPPVYPVQSDTARWNAYVLASTEWNARYQSFHRNRNDAWTALGKALDRRNMKLFGWWRDWNIGTASEATGGYAFGDLQWGAWSWWRTGDSLLVPELFGASRRGWTEGFQGMDLSHSGLSVDSFAHDLATNNGLYTWRDTPIFIRPLPIVTVNRSAAPITILAARTATSSLPESLVVNLAGRQSTAGMLKVDLEGHWGGLKVRASRSVQVPVTGGEAGASLWAYEYSRSLQPWVWSFDTVTNAVRNLGRAYRVATTATSFLALEPGMVPFDSIGGQGTETKAGDTRSLSMVSYASTADTFASTGNILLDSLTLESLLVGRVLATSPRNGAARKAMRLVGSNGLTIHAETSMEAPQVRILDLQGRQLASPAMSASSQGWSANWRPSRTTFVVVQMLQSGKLSTERILVRP